MDKRADFFGISEYRIVCDPFRVKSVWRMSPGVAACGLTPGYIWQPFRLPKTDDSVVALNR